MTFPTTTVQGTLCGPDGTTIGGARLVFKLSHADTDLATNTAIAQGDKIVITASDGTFTVDLWPNVNGAKSTYYDVEAFANGQRLSYGKIQVPETGPVELAALLRTAIVVSKDINAEMAASVLRAETAAQEARSHAESVDMPALQAQVDTYTNGAKALFPVTPNLLQDTRNFDAFCGGQKRVEQDLMAALAVPWSGGYLGGVATATAEVVHWADFAAEGIPTGGPLSVMEGSTPSATDFCALVLDVTNPEDVITKIAQGGKQAIGQNAGGHRSQTSLFAAVLDGSGATALDFGINHSTVSVDQSALGQGWQHYTDVDSVGYRWSELWARIHGTGRLRVALALPYLGLGDHGGIPIWAGSVGAYHVGDVA
jgi:hypothetical protein